MKKIKDAIKKITGEDVKYIFSYNLSSGGFIDYGTGKQTKSIEYEKIKKYL